MYKKYNKLLFFSVPKILSLHKVLVSPDLSDDQIVDEMVDKMAHEIGVLFENGPEAIGKLKTAIKVANINFAKFHAWIWKHILINLLMY